MLGLRQLSSIRCADGTAPTNLQDPDTDLTTVPIDSKNAAASLSLQDVPHYNHHRNRRNGRSYRQALIVLSILALVTIFMLIVLKRGQEGTSNALMIDKVTHFLQTRGISNAADLANPNSPQYQAAVWMAENEAVVPPELVMKNDEENNNNYYSEYVNKYILVLMAIAMDYESWSMSMNFLQAAPQQGDLCDWHGMKYQPSNGNDNWDLLVVGDGGVRCDGDRLVSLDLSFNQLNGDIPTEVGLLTTLRNLDLSMNDNIVGTIPTELCQLTNLMHLSLDGNLLDDALPHCTNWTEMRSIKLSDNFLSGTMPTEMCSMTKLQHFAISGNSINGTLPACIGKWKELETLKISDNQFSNDLPTSLTRLMALRELYLDGNDFEGDPLPTFETLIHLEYLYAEDNNFNGSIPDGFGRDLNQLMALDLSRNGFTSAGEHFPTQLLQLPNLHVLDVSMNSIHGHLPENLQPNKQLWFFSAYDNGLHGSIPSSLRNLVALKHLDLSHNNFTGPMRKAIFEIDTLENLFLSENPNLHRGIVPRIVTNLTNLRELSLQNTNRNGTLPNLKGLMGLELVDLDNNDFEGTIPAHYGQELAELKFLLLGRNPKLHGNIPTFSNDHSSLKMLFLDDTSVVGNFESVCKLASVTGGELATIVTTCSDDIACSCCKCCKNSCSDLYVSNLDWTWEYEFRRKAHNYGLNTTALQGPAV